MKLIKYVLLLILIILIGGAVYIATLKSDYQIEESMTVAAPATLLYQTIGEYKTWEEWAPWLEEEGVVIRYPETTRGINASYSWNAVDYNGVFKTIKNIPNRSIEQQVEIENQITRTISQSFWTLEPQKDNQTKLTWRIEGKKTFKEKIYEVVFGKSAIDVFKGLLIPSLENISTKIQKTMSEYSIHTDGITEHGGGFYMYMTTASSIEGIAMKAPKMFLAIDTYMEQNNLPISGKPFVLYNSVDQTNNTAIISAAIGTRSKVVTPSTSTVLCGFLEKQKMVKTTLKGNHKNLQKAWSQVDDYINKNQLEKDPQGTSFEIYTSSQNDTANPAAWITELYMPIK